MVWTDPTAHIYATSEVVSSSTLNTYVEANLASLYGDTGWSGPGFINTWANTGGAFATAAYRKVGTTVQLRGRIKSGVMSSAAFILPAGYRPPAALYFSVPSNAAYGQLQISADGSVIPVAGSNLDFSINVVFDTLA